MLAGSGQTGGVRRSTPPPNFPGSFCRDQARFDARCGWARERDASWNRPTACGRVARQGASPWLAIQSGGLPVTRPEQPESLNTKRWLTWGV